MIVIDEQGIRVMSDRESSAELKRKAEEEKVKKDEDPVLHGRIGEAD